MKQLYDQHAKPLPTLEVGEPVYVKPSPQENSQMWKEGIAVESCPQDCTQLPWMGKFIGTTDHISSQGTPLPKQVMSTCKKTNQQQAQRRSREVQCDSRATEKYKDEESPRPVKGFN